MKLMLALSFLMLAQLSFAETMREKNIRREMIERMDTFDLKIDIARKDLKKDKVAEACVIIDDLFESYDEHLRDVGTYMNLSKKRINKMKDAVMGQLIQLHMMSNNCKRGSNSEFVDPKQYRKDLAKLEKSLKRQREVIEDNKVNHENEFSYHYEF